MRILGIETSCDETGIALYDSEVGLQAHALHSQIDLHSEYGGVVPELASRDHVLKTLPLIQQVLDSIGLKGSDIQGVAYTAGPGLVGALLVGAAIGRSLAWAWSVPAVAINHMEGHILATMLEDNPPECPFIALLVSGGHSQLVHVEAIGQYTIIGDTLDDAVGEAFDKTAKLLGLDYPGGPALERLAKQGSPGRFKFPRPMTNRPGLDFSFSGLKTFAINTLQNNTPTKQTKADIAYAFQEAVTDTFVIKCRRAMETTRLNQLVIAGGVSANLRLREKLTQLTQDVGAEIFFPRAEFCTDNGAMIAYAGYLRINEGESATPEFNAYPRWSIDELAPLKS